MKYRSLHNWKYQLTEDYSILTQIIPLIPIKTPFIELNDYGKLLIRTGYAWDGATGAIDTDTIMRASLVHDSVYQVMREGLLSRLNSKKADLLFKRICLQDGMCKFRAWYLYIGLRIYSKIRGW